MDIKKIISNVVVCILSFIFIIVGYNMSPYNTMQGDTEKSYKAKVISIVDKQEHKYDLGKEMTNINVIFKAKITSGKYKNKTVTANQDLDDTIIEKPKQVAKGDSIIISYSQNDNNTSGENKNTVNNDNQDNNSSNDLSDNTNIGNSDNQNVKSQGQWCFVNYNRSNVLLWLIGFFFLLIIIIGRKKGVSTLISLAITLGTIFFVFIPSILYGRNIYLTTIIISIFIIFTSLILINGINIKTICAVAGNIGGLAVAGLLALLMNRLLHITGMVDENYAFLSQVNNGVSINLKAVIWGAIVIGALGAVMDVAMSIASSMNELSHTMKEKTFRSMVHSGMNIGKDAIGTMTNTLILAYIGSSLATILLFIVYSKDITYLTNLEMIVVDVMQAVVGSIGILFAVPATVLLSAKLFCRKK